MQLSNSTLRIQSIQILFVCLIVGFFMSCTNSIPVPKSPYPISKDAFTTETIAASFSIPYGIAIVSEKEYFITDRIGKLYHFKDNKLSEISGMPEVFTFGVPGIRAILHGGLMDISLHPNYEMNAWIYVTYLPIDGFARVSRFKVKNHTAIQFEEIFKTSSQNYYGNGMRIVWQDSSHFFLNIGCSNYSTYSQPVLLAQDFKEDAGKIHRLKEDGSIPVDNPILQGMHAPTTIWSYGHRDVQGLHFDAATNTLFGAEHGPKGGDEFNLIEKGKNYGWPLFSYGIDYSGVAVSIISKDSATTNTVLPEHFWTVPTPDGGQAIAPACLLKVEGSTISAWNSQFLLGSLAFGRLMKYNRETDETYGLNIEGRVRTIKQLPSGDIIALIERNHLHKANGKIIRIKATSNFSEN